MCCGGTVATMFAAPLAQTALALSALLAHTAPQVFAFASGTPVLPEVKAIATTRSGGSTGIDAVLPRKVCGSKNCRAGTGSSARSAST